MWFHNTDLWWKNNQCLRHGGYIGCVGMVSYRDMPAAYGIWRDNFGSDNRVLIEPCQSIEQGKRLVEEWLEDNANFVELGLCDECFTRHAPGGNDLCTR